MKKLVFSVMVLVVSSGITFGTLEGNWVRWTDGSGSWSQNSNWLRYDGAVVSPVYWNPVYIGEGMAAGSTANVTVASGVNAETLGTYLGMASDPAAASILNIESGAGCYVGFKANGSGTGTVFFKAGSKATVNLSGTLKTWGLDLNGADVTIDNGGLLQVTANYWYVRNGAAVTVNDGGILLMSSTSAYGSTGTSGVVDLCGGTLKMSGDKVVSLGTYIANDFITAYGDSDDTKLEVTYDGSYTYVTAIPEPATLVLMGLGGILSFRRRR